MPGPLPKAPEDRVRATTGNVAVGEWRTLPAEGFGGSVPELPATYGEGVEFLPATRQWFATWARSPQAAVFVSTDWQRLSGIVAVLVDRWHRDPSSTSLAAEIRLQERELG